MNLLGKFKIYISQPLCYPWLPVRTYTNLGYFLNIIELECFSTYFQKKYTILRLEDIFRLKQSFSIHFVSLWSESSNLSLFNIKRFMTIRYRKCFDTSCLYKFVNLYFQYDWEWDLTWISARCVHLCYV